METFQQSDLVYEYAWSTYAKDDPRISGPPDGTAFNRKEGWEVLYIVNYLTDHLAWGVDSFGHRMERFVHDLLPEDITTQREAIQWIKDHWKNPAMDNQ
jgi:hypothetical protein